MGDFRYPRIFLFFADLLFPDGFLRWCLFGGFWGFLYDVSVLLQQDFPEFLGVAEKSSEFFHRKGRDPFVANGTDFIVSS